MESFRHLRLEDGKFDDGQTNRLRPPIWITHLKPLDGASTHQMASRSFEELSILNDSHFYILHQLKMGQGEKNVILSL